MWIRYQNSYSYRCGLRDTWWISGLLLYFRINLCSCPLLPSRRNREGFFFRLEELSLLTLYYRFSANTGVSETHLRERERVSALLPQRLPQAYRSFLPCFRNDSDNDLIPSATVSSSIPSPFDDIDLAVSLVCLISAHVWLRMTVGWRAAAYGQNVFHLWFQSTWLFCPVSGH